MTLDGVTDIILHVFLEVKHEKNISTKYQKKEKEPRVQKKDEYKVRKGYYKEEEAIRQKEVERLSTPHEYPEEHPRVPKGR